MSLVSFTILTGILSSPGDVDDFSLLITLTIYSGVTSLNLNTVFSGFTKRFKDFKLLFFHVKDVYAGKYP